MWRADWEVISWIATTIASGLGVLGLGFVAFELKQQRKQSRLEFLNRLYGEFDTSAARETRAEIYRMRGDELRLPFLHAVGNEARRRSVEETLAMLERLAYPICKQQVPPDDAFELYGGVLLSLAHQLWPYVEDQREMRRKGGLRLRLSYRRFLEAVAREWAPKYAEAGGLPDLDVSKTTAELLRDLFPAKADPSEREPDSNRSEASLI